MNNTTIMQTVTLDAAAVDAAIVAFFEATWRLSDAGFDGGLFPDALEGAGADLLKAAYWVEGEPEETLEPIFDRLNARAERRELLGDRHGR